MIKRKVNIILLHPPSVYDFRRMPIAFGPISDVVPSTFIFELYPVGFSSLVEYLNRNGFSARIINVAYLMLRSESFDVERMISGLRADLFGIDLHWLPHAHGAIELARICKKHHPDTPVVMGGYSATYFHREIMEYPWVDYIIRGDSAEEPLLALLKMIRGEERPEFVPNLTWRRDGKVMENPLSYVPEKLGDFANNYLRLFVNSIVYGDLKRMTPIYDWWEYPITAVITCRGCTHNCGFCGGSGWSIKRLIGRRSPAYRPPHLLARDIAQIARYLSGPIFVVGDIRQAGDEYAHTLLDLLKGARIKNNVVLELFDSAPRAYFSEVSQALHNFNFQMSPETHDEALRKLAGKSYTNEEIESCIKWALDAGCRKFDVFFMIGIPGQTRQSVMSTVEYAGYLMERFGSRVVPFISPLAPFLDPGSIYYEMPERYGYRILFKKFDEYRHVLTMPSWKYMLNYETEKMSRDDIVDATYDAGVRLNVLKYKHGVVNEATYKITEDKINSARSIMEKIDKIMALEDEGLRSHELTSLQRELDMVNASTICHESEIKWPSIGKNFKFLNIAADLTATLIKDFLKKKIC